MLATFTKAIAVGGIATLAYATTSLIAPFPAAAQFSKGYSLDHDDEAFDHRPARRKVMIEDDYDEPRVERRNIEREIVRPIVERHVVEREVVQPVVERTVVRRVVQPVVERRIVYRQPIVRKVIVVHKPVVRRAYHVHRPWHGRRCFLPERYLCG